MKDTNKNICKGLTFSDCELAILRMSVDKAEEKIMFDLQEKIKIGRMNRSNFFITV
jgi:hypothetical protein